MPKPEDEARESIDAALEAAGWAVQDRKQVNLAARFGIAIREFQLARGFGVADYLLYVDGQAVGALEAKKEGETLADVELQSEKYSKGLPDNLPAPVRPLPFRYESTGVETFFTNRLDPEPRSRRLFAFHRPESLWSVLRTGLLPLGASGISAETRDGWGEVETTRRRLRQMPPINAEGLRPVQRAAIERLERSLADDRPRALIQMTMGAGKTITAIAETYRLIKFGGVRRALFLVDRANLGRQTKKEFDAYVTPDDGRRFTELYNVQLLTSNKLDPVARVCICTIQRMYSILRGEEELDPTLEEGSAADTMAALAKEPPPLRYNPRIPVETFDLVVTDECHRSIYNLWRQVLEYFDAYIVGLTATPSKQTLGFFNQNLVIEYGFQQAVADGINVDYDVYRIRTEITESGSRVQAGYVLDFRERATRRVRWEQIEEDLEYGASALDRDVVAPDQIRTVVRTYRDRVLTELFPGRDEVPKTLIYAKDDSHAEDIVRIVREEFGKGNDFAQKITYRTGVVARVQTVVGEDGRQVEQLDWTRAAGLNAEQLLSQFRNSFNPRIVVTVDMLATGVDIRPLEVVMFMRDVKSRTFFEQMKGRGVRVVSETELKAVTPSASQKDRFVLVDCVGVTERDQGDSPPLERRPTASLEKLLDAVAFGTTDPEILSSVASRLARLDRQLGKAEQEALASLAGGATVKEIAAGLVEALDADRQVEAARQASGLPADQEPTPEAVEEAKRALLRAAVAPLATSPALRRQLVDARRRLEQVIDTLSVDRVVDAGFTTDKARELVMSFREFIEGNRDEITALQVLYSRPYARRLRFEDIKRLAEAIEAPPRSWTGERLWRAYQALEGSRVRGAGGKVLTDVVALVRYALRQDGELVPFPDQVRQRFDGWLAMQETSSGRAFTDEQRMWLELIRDQIAASFSVELADFDLSPFAQQGGAGRAYQVFGDRLEPLLEELNRELVA